MNALILVDIQNDFLPMGALAISHGDEVVSVANAIMPKFDLVVATQDWHPKDHGSFAANNSGRQIGDVVDLNGLQQILWPVHCVQGLRGAEFAPDLDISQARVFRKGTDPAIDSYSAFFDNGHRKSTGLGDFLKLKNVTHLYVLGLATDYCVKFSALDARALGFATTLIVDGCRGVELKAGDCERAIEEMKAAGVKTTLSTALELKS